MKNMMEYKGYFGTVEYSKEDNCLFGKLAFIGDLVSYEGEAVSTLETAFHEAVDDYISECESSDKVPKKPFKGSFSVRPGEVLHREVMKASNGELNAFVCEAIQEKLERDKGEYKQKNNR